MTRVQFAVRPVMMGVTLLLAGVLLSGCPDNSAIVTIKDPALDNAVRRELGKYFGFLTVNDMEDLEVLDARSRNITDLSGLEFAINLVVLDLDTNQISDIVPLTNLINLETLNLDSNEVFDLTPLAGLLQLTTLSLFDNQVGDLSPLLTNAQAGGLGEGDLVVIDGATLNETALQQANTLVSDFNVNVVLAQPAG